MSVADTGRGRSILVLIVIAAGIAASTATFFVGRNQGKIEARRAERKKDATRISEGPWGQIRYWETLLVMPWSLISQVSRPLGNSEWYFGVGSTGEVAQTLTECGMDRAATAKAMTTVDRWPQGGFVLRPDDDLVINIPADARAKLYRCLSRWPQNEAMSRPSRFEKMGALDWLDQIDIPEKSAQIARKLIYHDGATQLFVDYDIVIRSLPDNRDAREFLRTMTRQNCIMGSLVIRPNDDIEKLVAYWGRGGREREVRTLIESARWADSRHEMPILMLLPHFVRDRLYRYRNDTDPGGANCHYSSLNFFSKEPEDSYTNLASCSAAIDRDYADVTTNDRQLGDLVLLMNGENNVVHSCNFVASDIVFTKNGTARGQPWVLANLQQVVNYFNVEQPVTVRVMRRKDFATTK